MERAWRIQGLPKFFCVPPIISGTGKATELKFGGYIYRANPNKSPLKFLRKGSVGVSRDCPNFLGTPIISGTDKATDFKLCTNIHRVDPNKSP